MENVTSGHWIFAGVFFVLFIIGMAWAYRKDFQRIGKQYRRVWVVLLGLIVIFLCIYAAARFL